MKIVVKFLILVVTVPVVNGWEKDPIPEWDADVESLSANAAFANFLQCKMSCFESEFLDDFNLGEDVIKDVYSFAGVSTRIQRNMVCSGFSDFFKTPIVEVDLINGLLKAVFQSSDNFSFCWVGGDFVSTGIVGDDLSFELIGNVSNIYTWQGFTIMAEFIVVDGQVVINGDPIATSNVGKGEGSTKMRGIQDPNIPKSLMDLVMDGVSDSPFGHLDTGLDDSDVLHLLEDEMKTLLTNAFAETGFFHILRTLDCC